VNIINLIVNICKVAHMPKSFKKFRTILGLAYSILKSIKKRNMLIQWSTHVLEWTVIYHPLLELHQHSCKIYIKTTQKSLCLLLCWHYSQYSIFNIDCRPIVNSMFKTATDIGIVGWFRHRSCRTADALEDDRRSFIPTQEWITTWACFVSLLFILYILSRPMPIYS
jgi:hypothetical protein